MKRILVTGSRDWPNRAAVWKAIYEQARGTDRVVVVHGGARGADRHAAEWCHEVASNGLPATEEEHPADWNRYGKSAGHRRNAEMVTLGADVCLAFPLGESRGTRGCMALAEKAGIPVISYEGSHA